jgi:hypothetical protein
MREAWLAFRFFQRERFSWKQDADVVRTGAHVNPRSQVLVDGFIGVVDPRLIAFGFTPNS